MCSMRTPKAGYLLHVCTKPSVVSKIGSKIAGNQVPLFQQENFPAAHQQDRRKTGKEIEKIVQLRDQNSANTKDANLFPVGL